MIVQTRNQHTGHILASSSLLANERQTEAETAREPPAFAEDAAATPPLPSHLSAHVYLSVTPAPRGHFCLPLHLKPFTLSDFTPLPLQASSHHCPHFPTLSV